MIRTLIIALALLAAVPAIAADRGPGFVKTPMCGAVQMPDGSWRCPDKPAPR